MSYRFFTATRNLSDRHHSFDQFKIGFVNILSMFHKLEIIDKFREIVSISRKIFDLGHVSGMKNVDKIFCGPSQRTFQVYFTVLVIE